MEKQSANPIFNSRATEKLRSPDDLDKYMRVANPSVWVVIAACAALLIGILIWGIFGAVTTSVSATGVNVEGKAMCFLAADDAAKVNVGDEAAVDGKRMTVYKIAPVPVSRDEAYDILTSDYLVSTLVSGDWAYQIIFEGDTSTIAEHVPLTVSITTERIAPITLILGGMTNQTQTQ